MEDRHGDVTHFALSDFVAEVDNWRDEDDASDIVSMPGGGADSALSFTLTSSDGGDDSSDDDGEDEVM